MPRTLNLEWLGSCNKVGNLEWLAGFRCSLEQWNKTQHRIFRTWEGSCCLQRTWNRGKRGHVLLSGPLPRVTRGCSRGPMGSYMPQWATSQWHGNVLEYGSSINCRWACANNQDARSIPGLGLPTPPPYGGCHSVAIPLLSAYTSLFQTTPFLLSFSGSNGTLCPP